jgi:hypothetical protein
MVTLAASQARVLTAQAVVQNNQIDPNTVAPCSMRPWGYESHNCAPTTPVPLLLSGQDPSYPREPYEQKFWSEDLHARVLGEPSLLVFLEVFTSANLQAWFTADGIASAVYDLTSGTGAIVDSYLIARSTSLVKSFHEIFQGGRWSVNPQGVRVEGVGKDNAPHAWWIQTWVEGARPNPQLMADALKKIDTKYTGTLGQLDFFAKAWPVIKQVPRYTGPCCDYRSAPAIGVWWDWYNQPLPMDVNHFWRIQNGELVPSAWSNSMLDLFAPPVKSIRPAVAGKLITGVKAATRKKLIVSVNAISSVRKTSTNTIAKAAAVGVVVGVGGLFWLFL